MALQDPEADELLGGIGRGAAAGSWHLVEADGRVYSAGAAFASCACSPAGRLAAVADASRVHGARVPYVARTRGPRRASLVLGSEGGVRASDVPRRLRPWHLFLHCVLTGLRSGRGAGGHPLRLRLRLLPAVGGARSSAGTGRAACGPSRCQDPEADELLGGMDERAEAGLLASGRRPTARPLGRAPPSRRSLRLLPGGRPLAALASPRFPRLDSERSRYRPTGRCATCAGLAPAC